MTASSGQYMNLVWAAAESVGYKLDDRASGAGVVERSFALERTTVDDLTCNTPAFANRVIGRFVAVIVVFDERIVIFRFHIGDIHAKRPSGIGCQSIRNNDNPVALVIAFIMFLIRHVRVCLQVVFDQPIAVCESLSNRSFITTQRNRWWL